MADHKSAKKRIRRNARAAEVNNARRTTMRTFIKKVVADVEAGDANAAQESLRVVQPLIQRAVAKGILKKNTAARKISRMSASIKRLKDSAA